MSGKTGELYRAATILERASLDTQARKFQARLDDATDNVSELLSVAAALHKDGSNQLAIQAAQKAEKLSGRSALIYTYPVIAAAKANGQTAEPAAILSIIRQESRFNETAVSRADARGLMQLLPSTARETAGKRGLSYQTAWLTGRPDYNVKLGSSYLAQMLARYDGYYPLAAAAYNAGPGRVDRWLREIGDPRTGAISMLDWVELIPIYETRNYAQRVSEGVELYRLLLGNDNRPRGKTHLDTYRPL